MTRRRSLLVLCAALVLLGAALVPAVGMAQDDDGDEDDEMEAEQEDEQEQEDEDRDEEADDDDLEEKRAIKLETEGNDVTIKLERETQPSENEVEMKWDAEEATFELEYEAENETQETEHELKATFQGLAEYRDENDNDRYDPGEEIVSGWQLADEDEDDMDLDHEAEWTTPLIDDVTRDGKQGKLIESTARLGDQSDFTLRFLVFGDFVEFDDTDLAPTGAKIDIVIEEYPYQQNGTDLALFLETETESELEVDLDDEDESGVTAAHPINETQPRLAFTWKDTAQVEGTTHDVGTTLLEEKVEVERDAEESEREHERTFALSYPRGDEIVHDPKAEVVTSSDQAASVPSVGLAVVLTSLAGLAAIKRFR